MDLNELAGTDLGTRELSFTADDAILYALAVGAGASDLGLIYERDLQVLPTYACALGLWAVEAAGELGAYDRTKSLHVGQRLEMKESLMPGRITMTGSIGNVYDRKKATIVEVLVSAQQFEAGYTIFLPGVGGWGGPPPPPSERRDEADPEWVTTEAIGSTAAALYRLTGDKHPVHIEHETAQAMGLHGPILHGLATLGIAARAASAFVDASPTDVTALDVRLSAPVYPGSDLVVGASRGVEVGDIIVNAAVGDTTAMSGTVAYQA